MRKMLFTLLALVLAVVLAACKEQELGLEIPVLTYSASSQSYRVGETYSNQLRSVSSAEDYESPYALYHFDTQIPNDQRDRCVYYSDLLLSRLNLEEKPELLIISDYTGAFIGVECLYLGEQDFSSFDYGAQLLTLVYGGYANYGAAYGYTAWIQGYTEEQGVALSQSPARDLNCLCFREEFVSPEEIAENKKAACLFVQDYIETKGEAAYLELLKQSGSPATEENFREALAAWYARQGLDYTPSEVLYSIGGEYHDYLVQHTHATMYMAKTFRNSWPTQEEGFLHQSYETVKYFFELSLTQMEAVQEMLGFDVEYEPVTVEFLGTHRRSLAYPYHGKIELGCVEDFCHEYTHCLNTRHMRTDYDQYRWVDESLTEYVALRVPNPYYFQFLKHVKENGFNAGKGTEGYDEVYQDATADVEDPLELWRIRWDLYPYYYEDYTLGAKNMGLQSFPAYVIDTLGYETLYNFGYKTDQEPPELDLEQLRRDWIVYLEERYGQYPRYSEYMAQLEAQGA